MPSKDYYKTLWVSNSATQADIKKAYRGLAMKYHPDRNKGNKDAETKFKEINEAYWILWESEKRKQYDSFGSNFSWASWGQWSSFNGGAWFEDIFSNFWGSTRWWGTQNFDFDFWDLFWNVAWGRQNKRQSAYDDLEDIEKKEESRDIEKRYEVPIFDLILGCKIEVEWEKRNKAKLKIPEGTKPGTKFRIKDMGKTLGWKKWNLIVTVDAKMPKHISEVDKSLLERIRENTWY